MTSYSVQKQALHKPSLEEVSKVLQKGLASNFEEVTCEVVQCPDLTKGPWGLSAEGLCGSPRIGELGGVKYLCPFPKLDKVYDLKEIAKQIDLPECLLIGAGAGPHPYVGKNCELISNLKTGKEYKNGTRVTKVNETNDVCILEKLPLDEARCALMLNFFACEGVKGPVLRVHAKKRSGSDDFVGSMRKALEAEYGSKPVGVGGTFLMKKGTAKIHVMPEFSKVALNSEEDVNKWLSFFDMKGPMLFMSVFLSRDPGLDFRVEHTHGYTETQGGHYHFDTTPAEVEYEGYFNVADLVYRVDKP